MERPTVVIVEPDATSRREFEEALLPSSIDVRPAATRREALDLLAEGGASLIVTELSLPDGSGFGLCRLVRESPELDGLPVMMVSTWAEEVDRILAFECGADDFLPKPFYGRELVARVRALLRRTRRPSDEPPPVATADSDLVIDPLHNEVRESGRRIQLTPREFALLEALLENRGFVLSRRQLIEQAWGPEGQPSDRSVDAHMKSLRRKLGPVRRYLQTVRGIGYRFGDAPAKRAVP